MKNSMRLVRLAVFAILVGIASQAMAAPNLDFDLVNKTGFDIKAVFVAPNNQEDWEENILDGILENGETLEVSFSRGQTTTIWDIMVIWTDDDAAYWRGYNLSELSRLTLFYDIDTDVASAKAE